MPCLYTYTLKNHHNRDDTTTIKASIELKNNQLKLEYQIVTDLSQYSLPKQTKQQRVDNLWLDTCFELFIANVNDDRYWEINISPSTEWNIYQFRSYKDDMRESNSLITPIIKRYRYDNKYYLSFESKVQRDIWSRELQINLCVILLDIKGVRQFYSIERRKGSPDFHDRDYFTKININRVLSKKSYNTPI